MSLIELLQHVGLENVRFQPLASCMTAANTNKLGITKVTFETKEISTTDAVLETGKAGFIIWIPKDKLPKP